MRVKLYHILALVMIISMIASPAGARAIPTVGMAAPAVSAPQTFIPEGEGFDLDAFRSAMSGVSPSQSGPGQPAQPVDPEGLRRLQEESGGAQIAVERTTGAAGFVRLSTDQAERLAARLGGGTPEQVAAEFFRQYGSIFGMRSPAEELTPPVSRTDHLGFTRLTYQQVYQGVPVFAGVMHAHFNPQGRLTSVNGVFVPGIELDVTPRLSAEQAAEIAMRSVRALDVRAVNTTLYVFRQGIASGQTGANLLAYEVEVSNDRTVREFIFVDAHKGQIVQRFDGIHNELDREVYDGSFAPANLVWKEGDPPYTGGDPEVEHLIDFTEDTYEVIANVSGGTFLSWDGDSATMIGVANYNPPGFCPNAHWIGTRTEFCPGISGDDTVAHEWGHAYTQETHGLIYFWQSGALNESYSDIIGEAVDMLNGAGTDEPDVTRSANTCSAFTPAQATLLVNSPAAIAGNYLAQFASFGPPLDDTGITGDVVLAEDVGGVSTTDGCEAISTDLTGKIALIDRGTCNFTVKVFNAQEAGAIGVIIANHEATGLPGMGGADPAVTIPSIGVSLETGNLLKDHLAEPPNVTLKTTSADADNSIRWLSGEDDDGGAIRDLWNPNCYMDPGKTTDPLYVCGTTDNGGVHTNSGVPNHGFALMVDGGDYNGQSITGIGLTKAFHIYWRAMSEYQTLTSDFVDHADSLEQSCQDLTGIELTSLEDGSPSGEMITPSDCAEVAKVVAAVELREAPTQCGYTPLLDPDAPAVCSTTPDVLFEEDFETASASGWTITVEQGENEWELSSDLPDGEAGRAFFAPDPNYACDADHTGLTTLTSPEFTIPEGVGHPKLTFDHYVATEAGWDGGNVWLVVNGVEMMVAPEHFIFNTYPALIDPMGGDNTNPLTGLPGFTGTDGGSNTGSWAQSQIDLGPYVKYGDTVQVRFKMGVDFCSGVIGWYVDNVQVSACSAATGPDPQPALPGGGDTLSALKFAGPKQEEVTFSLLNWGNDPLEWSVDEDGGDPSSFARDDAPTARPGGSGQGKNTVEDGSFESGDPWNETVLTLFSAFCSLGTCGADLALDGSWFLWWGDFDPPAQHHTVVSQTIPLANTGMAVLGFYVGATGSIGGAPLDGDDSLVVTMDGDELFTLDASNQDDYEPYTYVELDISAYADGGQHVLAFEANTVGGIILDFVFTEDFDYPCDTLADIPWLEVQPQSGVVAPRSSTDIVAAFDSTGLDPGLYSAHLCINTNSSEKPLFVVPVEMEVVENQAPAMDPIADLEGDEGEVITTTVTAADPDIATLGDALTFSLDEAPAGASIDPVTGLFAWTPGEEHGGSTFTVTVVVSDKGGLTASRSFEITVNEVNQPPVLDPIDDITVQLNQMVTFTVSATDGDIPADTLTLSMEDGPSGASFDPATGQFSWKTDSIGAFQATFAASDGKATSSMTVNITVEGRRLLLPLIFYGG